MSAQVQKLQALLTRVQSNRSKPRPTNGVAAVAAPAPQTVAAAAAPARLPAPAIAKPSAFEEALPSATPAEDPFDTMPPPSAFAKPQPHLHRPSAEPAPRAVRPAIEAEHVRVPDIKPARPAAQVPQQVERPLPAPARPLAPGATPLEMALEGEVARAAESAAASLPAAAPAAPAQRIDARAEPIRELEGGAGRILADPTPPQPTRAIVQATTKHPPAQPNSFAELLKRSLALRPR